MRSSDRARSNDEKNGMVCVNPTSKFRQVCPIFNGFLFPHIGYKKNMF